MSASSEPTLRAQRAAKPGGEAVIALGRLLRRGRDGAEPPPPLAVGRASGVGRTLLALVAGVLLAGGACGTSGPVLVVFAAASLADGLGEVGRAYERENPGFRVRFSFAGSSRLAAQLAEGARADVFASADERQMARLAQDGLLAGPATAFAGTSVAVALPRDNPAWIHAPADLALPGVRIAIAAPSVPAGAYAETVIDLLASAGGLGAAFAEGVRANLVSQEDSVRRVLAKVALGEVDAGFVYATDARSSDRVVTLALPSLAAVPVRYPIVALAGGDALAAERFIAFVRSVAGQEILARHGFSGPAPR